MSHPLPRFTNTTTQDKRQIDKILGETPPTTNQPNHRATAPGDTRKLRGIPVAGGACGTSPGTDPLQAIILKEHLSNRSNRL